MQSKTPNFDRALDGYFSKLELDKKGGQWRVCRFSGEKFYVRPEDIKFYKKMRVPLPTMSPNERLRLLLSSWNSYFLFNSTSAFSGKKIVTQFPPNTDEPLCCFSHCQNQRCGGCREQAGATVLKSFFDQF